VKNQERRVYGLRGGASCSSWTKIRGRDVSDTGSGTVTGYSLGRKKRHRSWRKGSLKASRFLGRRTTPRGRLLRHRYFGLSPGEVCRTYVANSGISNYLVNYHAVPIRTTGGTSANEKLNTALAALTHQPPPWGIADGRAPRQRLSPRRTGCRVKDRPGPANEGIGYGEHASGRAGPQAVLVIKEV